MSIINLTQHVASETQTEAGVFEPSTINKKKVKNLLLFEVAPDRNELISRAVVLAAIAGEEKADAAMIGGAGYLLPYLEEILEDHGITALHSFSKRVSIEEVVDGKTIKRAVFEHRGWVGGKTHSMFV